MVQSFQWFFFFESSQAARVTARTDSNRMPSAVDSFSFQILAVILNGLHMYIHSNTYVSICLWYKFEVINVTTLCIPLWRRKAQLSSLYVYPTNDILLSYLYFALSSLTTFMCVTIIYQNRTGVLKRTHTYSDKTHFQPSCRCTFTIENGSISGLV